VDVLEAAADVDGAGARRGARYVSNVTDGPSSRTIRVIEATGKLRNGLFLREIRLYDDRIAFEVFASRPLGDEHLATLQLADDVGTNYQMVSPSGTLIDGRARIEFEPGAPADSSRLHLGQPGWGLHVPLQLD
jgi:hypothetical protein